jgi:hypothetical protein
MSEAVETSVSQIEPTNELTLLTVSASTCFNFNFISISTNFSYSLKSTLFHNERYQKMSEIRTKEIRGAKEK